jgi:hypothetical protein
MLILPLVRDLPPNKRLQLTSARLGCRSVSHGRRPPGCVLDSRASAGRHWQQHGAAAAEPRSVGQQDGALTLQDLGNLGELISAIAVVVWLAYLAVQIRQNTKSVRTSTYQAILDSSRSDTELILANPHLGHVY